MSTVEPMPDIYGTEPIYEVDSYIPNRLEYFAGLALQALLPIAPPKYRARCIPEAIALAKQLEDALDSEAD